jgi:glycyl-tRNA synthetase beta chain
VDATLLVELLTEELPPRSLKTLADVFASALFFDLNRSGFVADGGAVSAFATPRRLAMRITRVRERSPDSEREVQGPPLSAAPAAIAGFARKNGVAVEMLETRDSPKGKIHVARVRSEGIPLEVALADKVQAALKTLPIAKLMRWGAGEAQFVRPVHGLMMMHGTRVVPGEVLALKSGNRTHGHRFLGKRDIVLASADEYEAKLAEEGRVIADFGKRREEIEGLLQAEAKRQGAVLGDYADLLDEVTALVELPTVYVGEFDKAFLEVPQECLILTMRQNQKYFPLFSPDGRLTAKFLIVSNMRIPDARYIVAGNQRVVRPRLEDARFFFDQDRRERLEARVPRLAKVVYHNKLGSQLERVERVQLLAGNIARQLNSEPVLAERAAWLAKADLLTGMVGEFPELQGVMGGYYARHDGEPEEVAEAIEAHYRPRYAGDRLPESPVACAVALADKLVTLAGLFGIGQQPTGDKDPFGLRRAALGVIRILVERTYPLSLHDLVNDAFAVFPKGLVGQAHTDLSMFVFERFAGYLKERGCSTLEIDSVLCMNPVRLDLVPQQLDAVRAFLALPESSSLAAANKRVANILKQAEAKGESYGEIDAKALRDPAEIELAQALQAATSTASGLFDRGDYAGYLKTFAVLKTPVDRFFDDVMVMVDDAALRRNRLALLAALRSAMNRVADISRLAQ